MRKHTQSLRIAGIQLAMLWSKPKLWVFTAIAFAIVFRTIQPVVWMCLDYGRNASIWGGVVFMLNNMGVFWMISLYVMLLVYFFSDAPFLDANQELCMLRCGKRRWLAGQMLFVPALALICLLIWVAATVLILLPRGDWSMEWGAIWKTVAFGDASRKYGILADVPLFFLRQYSLPEALALTLLLKAGLFIFVGYVIFFLNLVSHSFVGTIVGFLLALQGMYAVNDAPFIYTWFSPTAMSSLHMLDKTATFLFPSPAQTLMIYGALILIMIALTLTIGKKRI